ncbi:sushi, von Willebrand factor type A, EGF and pentraxin domain-containing protein 1-like isoform X1 [Gordionus sp. m RMFG-2023]|uniref:sushi, von Willebrand factor type A, EGF and pentraxin domain-containing protein 1-like isoform X1 n=2 Tax=Gordionus sp. m RMFG-2023 TaxID=3053472 RepID=UPI0031FDB1B0
MPYYIWNFISMLILLCFTFTPAKISHIKDFCIIPPTVNNSFYSLLNIPLSHLSYKNAEAQQKIDQSFYTLPNRILNLQKSYISGVYKFPPNAQIQYHCNEGYYPVMILNKNYSQSMISKCIFIKDKLKWSTPSFYCAAVNCVHPGLLTNGQLRGNDFKYPHKVYYACLPGYELYGEEFRECQSNGKWSGNEPQCRIVRCQDIQHFPNGKVLSNGLNFGDMLHYECDRGFKLIGTKDRRCDENGIWIPDPPICIAVDCGYPGDLYNGFLELNSTKWGAVVIYWCSELSVFIGDSQSAICQLNEKWSHPLPRCMKNCIIASIDYATVPNFKLGDMITHNTTMNFSCVRQTSPYINMTTRCNNGSFEPVIRCEPEDCMDLPPRIKNGRSIVIRSKHGSAAKFICDPGYKIVSFERMVCKFGQWSGPLPQCSNIVCQFPGLLTNGQVFLVGSFGEYNYREYITNVQHGRQIAYKCDKNYYISYGPSGATCIDGKWNPPNKPICSSDMCPQILSDYRQRVKIFRSGDNKRNLRYSDSLSLKEINTIAGNHFLLPPDLSHFENFNNDPSQDYVALIETKSLANHFRTEGTIVEVTCIDDRFQMSLNSSMVRCIKGKWVPGWPTCIPKPCVVPIVKNGIVFFNGNIVFNDYKIDHGDLISVICNDGYNPSTAFTIFSCILTGWNPSIQDMKCLEASCTLPQSDEMKNSSKLHYSKDIIKHNKFINLNCSKSHNMKLDQKNLCLHGKSKPRSCDKEPCSLANSSNLKFPLNHRNKFPHGTVLEFSCPFGHKLMGKSFITCTYGIWKPEPPSCLLVRCMPPHVPKNGGYQVKYNDRKDSYPNIYVSGIKIEYNCWNGYTLIGTKHSECNEKGLWTLPIPLCNKIKTNDCRPNSIFDNATFKISSITRESKDNLDLFLEGTEIEYSCTMGSFKSWKSTCVKGNWTDVIDSSYCDLKNCSSFSRNSSIISYLNNTNVKISSDIPHNTMIYVKCLDVGQYLFSGSKYLRCWNGIWKPTLREQMPRCLDLRKYPTETFFPSPPEISVYAERDELMTNGEGKIIIPLGKKVIISCHFPRLYGTPTWKWNSKSQYYPLSWNSGTENGNDYEYTLTIPLSHSDDSGTYTCITPYRNQHEISIIFKNVHCPPINFDNNDNLLLKVISDTRDDYKMKTRIKFACVEGYRIFPQSEILCDADGSWSDIFPKCQKITCPEIRKNIENLIVQMQSEASIYNSIVTFACPKGSFIAGASHIICQFNGQWSAKIPTCIDVLCPEPKNIENGYYKILGKLKNDTQDFKYGTRLVYKCDTGYLIHEKTGSRFSKCLESGQWLNEVNSSTPQLPICHKRITSSCKLKFREILNVLKYGMVKPHNRYIFEPGEKVEFSCLPGFKRKGSRKSKCLSNGKWSKKFPTCILLINNMNTGE